MELLTEYRADVMKTDTDQKSALHVAAEWGHLGAVKYLVALGVPISAKDLNGVSSIFIILQLTMQMKMIK